MKSGIKYSQLIRFFDRLAIGTLISLAIISVTPPVAHAYVGPGAGITLIGALLGVVAAVGLAIAGILLWPVRSFLRRLKSKDKLKSEIDQAKS